MLELIPAPLHRLLYRIADRVRRRWWRIRKPHRRSAHIVAFDETGRVLLVRHSYGRPVWVFPGGGVGRREDPAAAAAREFREELACELTDLVPLGPCEIEESGSHDERHVFAARLAGVPAPDQREIVAAALFEPDALPDDSGRYVRHWIDQARTARSQQR